MKPYLQNTRLRVLPFGAGHCFMMIAALSMSFLSLASGGSESADIYGALTGSNSAKGGSGPTVTLTYSKTASMQNTIASFMYFVPLISPTHLDRKTSTGNTQKVGVISYEKKVYATSFFVNCEFEIQGNGFHKNVFEPREIIRTRSEDLKKKAPMKRILDYIKFEGEGFGIIEIEGTISGTTKTVTQVNVKFNGRGRISPVTIGLYDIKPMDGQYLYENRTNELVARVNTLTFKKDNGIPKMWITVASIDKTTPSNSLLSIFRGIIANLLIKPPDIAKIGNEAMLDFGYAIFNQEPEFTFPRADNIIECKTKKSLSH